MKTTQEIDVFSLTMLQDKPATLYNHDKEQLTYIYVGADRYDIPPGTMALMRGGDYPLKEKMVGFKFNQDVKLDGQIAVLQVDEYYMVTFVTDAFSGLNGEEAVNDVIMLCTGNALVDVDNI